MDQEQSQQYTVHLLPRKTWISPWSVHAWMFLCKHHKISFSGLGFWEGKHSLEHGVTSNEMVAFMRGHWRPETVWLHWVRDRLERCISGNMKRSWAILWDFGIWSFFLRWTSYNGSQSSSGFYVTFVYVEPRWGYVTDISKPNKIYSRLKTFVLSQSTPFIFKVVLT